MAAAAKGTTGCKRKKNNWQLCLKMAVQYSMFVALLWQRLLLITVAFFSIVKACLKSWRPRISFRPFGKIPRTPPLTDVYARA
jgi:hypothetical protein